MQYNENFIPSKSSSNIESMESITLEDSSENSDEDGQQYTSNLTLISLEYEELDDYGNEIISKEAIKLDNLKILKKENSDTSNSENSQNSKNSNSDSKMILEKDNSLLSAKEEFKLLVKLAFPMCISSLSGNIVSNVDSIYVGHLGTKQLGGIEMAFNIIQFVTILAKAPGWSLNSLCSQSIGSDNHKMAGIWLQLTILLATIMFIPSIIVYFYVETILNSIHSNDINSYAGKFARYATLFLYTGVLYSILCNYLRAAEIVVPATVVSIMQIFINIFLNQILVAGIHIGPISYNGMGVIGSALSTTISTLIQLLCFYWYCFIYKKYHIKLNIWNKINLKILFNYKLIKSYFKVIIPNLISNISESWVYKIVDMWTITLSSKQIASLGITFQVFGFLWCWSWGFQTAATTRIGFYIGKGDIKKAKLIAKITVISMVVLHSTLGVIMYICKDYIGKLYTGNGKVNELVSNALTIFIIDYWLDSYVWSINSVLEGMSINKARTILTIVSVWFIYLPLTIYSGFYNNIFNMQPLEAIMFCGVICQIIRLICLSYILYYVDWNKAVIECQKRNENEEIDENILLLKKIEKQVSNESDKQSNKESNKNISIDDELTDNLIILNSDVTT